MKLITIRQAYENFLDLTENEDKSDTIAMSEEWNNYTDSLTKEGLLNSLQYSCCPGYGDDMPDNDYDLIIDAFCVEKKVDKRDIPLSISDFEELGELPEDSCWWDVIADAINFPANCIQELVQIAQLEG